MARLGNGSSPIFPHCIGSERVDTLGPVGLDISAIERRAGADVESPTMVVPVNNLQGNWLTPYPCIFKTWQPIKHRDNRQQSCH